MKKIMKITSFIAALVMSASAVSCSSGKPAEIKKLSAKGGYAEKKLEFAYGDLGPASEFTDIGGKVGAVLPFTDELCYISKDGTRIFRDVLSDLDEADNDDLATIFAASEYGYLYWKMNSNVWVLSPDGTENQVSGLENIMYAEFSEDGRLFACNTNGDILEVDISTGDTKKITGGNGIFSAFDIIGSNIIYIDDDGAHFYDIDSGRETEVPDALKDFLGSYRHERLTSGVAVDICRGNDDDIYIGCSDGLYRYVMGGNIIEQLIDGFVSRFGDPSDEMISLYCGEDGTLYGAFVSGVYSYRFDPELETAAASELKVYTLEKNNTVSKLISGFASENRGVKVDLQVGMKEGMTYSDAMKELTTQILSGNAPDVMILDGLDIENLIDKNMLTDLSENSEKWLPENDLLSNVVNWNDHDGKLCSVACRFRLPAVGAEEDELKKISSYADIADLCEEYREKYDPMDTIMGYYDVNDSVRVGLIYEWNRLFGSSPDKEALTEFFDSCKRLHDAEYADNTEASVTYWSPDVTSENAFSARFWGALGYKVIATGAVNDISRDMSLLTSVDESVLGKKLSYRLGISEDSRSFLPVCNIGITQSAKNTDDAYSFLAYALKDKTQENGNDYDGFPVNVKALKKIYSRNVNDEYDYTTSLDVYSDDGELKDTVELDIRSMDNAEVKAFDDYIKSLDEPVYIEYAVREIAEAAGEKCLSGTETAEQAAEETVKQLELRMKE
ncbi:MAG: extracellular solute-binding protein [Ruminococcus sp.]|nr:extracellular solute-binding protein [Ruminococcus sp.]